MKFTKLLAATFAALTLFSCSKESMTADNGPVLNPGDARVVLNLNNGTTTYATQGDENAIQTLAYALYDGENLITAVDNAPTNMGSVDLTISATDYANITDPTKVTLCVLANGSVATTAAMPATLAALRGATTNLSIKDASVATNGLVASRELTVDLTTAVNNTLELNPASNKAKLTRGVARFWVKSATTRGEIAGAVITINNINEGVTPFSSPANAGVVGTLYNDSYTVPTIAPLNQYTPTGSTDAQEAAFYAYPTASGVSIKVLLKNGDSKTVTVNAVIEANKNYSITITPKVVNGKTVVDNVEIAEWSLTPGSDTPVDMNSYVLKKATVGISADIIKNSDGIDCFTFANGDNTTFSYTLNEMFDTEVPSTVLAQYIASDIASGSPATYASNPTTLISKDNLLKVEVNPVDGKVTVSRNFNFKKDLIFPVEIAGSDNNIYIVNFILEGADYPENMTVNMDGVEIMTVSAYGPNFRTTIAAIEQADGTTFAEKTRNYVNTGLVAVPTTDVAYKASKAYDVLGDEAPYATQASACPAGFEIPTDAQLITALLNPGYPAILTSGYASTNKFDIGYVTRTAWGVKVTDKKTTAPDPLAVAEWSFVAENGNELYLPTQHQFLANMVTSTLGGSINIRYIFYGSTIEHRSTGPNSYARCVKKAPNFTN